MATTAEGHLALLFRTARIELLPFEGRFGMAWRVAAQCMLTAMLFMTYEIPLAAIGCYLVLFIMRPDSTESLLMAIAITILASVAVAFMFLVVPWIIDSPLWRMVALVGFSFLFLFIGAASPLGPLGAVVALVVAFIITLLSDVPFGEIATRGLLYAWLMAAVPMGVVVVFNLVFGRSSLTLLREGLAVRLEAVADALEGAQPRATLDRLLDQGNAALAKQAGLATLMHMTSSVKLGFLRNAVTATYRLLLAAANMPEGSGAQRSRLAEQCRSVARAVLNDQPVPACPGDVERGEAQLLPVQHALRALVDVDPTAAVEATSKKKKSFFFADALTNPAYQHYALRTTAAAVICYLVYTALDWQDIHTAMITCYVAALGSTGETLHKLFLRIVGCLIGAAMGMASILFFMPHMTSIASLMALVFAGVLVAGWVAAGSERSAYAGIQVGLAFLLTILQGYGPDVQMSVAWDRVVGILLGNFVMYIMFTKMWPISVFASVTPALERALDRLAVLAAQPDRKPVVSDISSIIAGLNQARESLQMLFFEPRALRPLDDDVARLHTVIDKAQRICRLVALPATSHSQELVEAVREIPALQRMVRNADT